MDDFGVKYFKKGNAEHLIAAIRANYDCSAAWTGNTHCGMSLKWNHEHEYVDVSMIDFVSRAPDKYNHTPST